MRGYYIWTIGCQMNKADSERLEGDLMRMGLVRASSPGGADVVVLNSCVVRQSAEDRVVGILSSLKSFKARIPDGVVALMGCMVDSNITELERRFPHVDLFMRPRRHRPLIDLLNERMGPATYMDERQPTASPGVTAYVPVIHGCNKFCSFCIVPYRRGRETSRAIDEIVRQVEQLAVRGVKEVTLLGQNVDSYGDDLSPPRGMEELLPAVSGVGGIERIRFLTSHPNDMSDGIIDAVAELDKVCTHISLPVQAGDDEVLGRMRRGYTSDSYRLLVEKICQRVPDVTLSTDVIVGFCGETEEQYRRTYDLIRDLRFDKVHVAAYSERSGTIAVRTMEDSVPREEKKARQQALEELQTGIQTDINNKLEGGTVEVLVEGMKRGKAQGRTRSDKLVFFEGGERLIGKVVQVKILEASPWSLQGAVESSA